MSEGIMRFFGFFILGAIIMTAIFGLAYFAEWQYVLQNQWITQPYVYYDWWQFIFAWDQAWAWLWLVNFPLWALVIGLIAGAIGYFIAFIVIAHT